MRIGELAERTGASPRSLRHYEKTGLLCATRSTGNYREFDDSAVDTVRIVQTLLRAGMNTATIAQVLPCVELIGGRATPCAGLRAELHSERDRLMAQQRDIERSVFVLDCVIASAPSE